MEPSHGASRRAADVQSQDSECPAPAVSRNGGLRVCTTAVPMQSARCVYDVLAGDVSWRPSWGGGDPRGVQPQHATVQLVLGQPPDRRLNLGSQALAPLSSLPRGRSTTPAPGPLRRPQRAGSTTGEPDLEQDLQRREQGSNPAPLSPMCVWDSSGPQPTSLGG